MITEDEKMSIRQEFELLAAGHPGLNFLLEVHEDYASDGAELVRMTAGPWHEEEKA